MKHFVRLPLLVLAFLLAMTVAPQSVWAHGGEQETSDTSQHEADDTLKTLLEQRREAAKKRLEDAKANLEDTKAAAKERFQKACQNRHESYKNRLLNIAERTEKHIQVLDKIVERVKAFKESKALTVENYEALLSDIEAKKLVAQSLQDVASDKANADFSCERDAALESVKAFGDILHQQIDALKGYKTAVKNLIVAVKTAAETVEGSNDED